jgi:hypothetical protein
MVLLQAGSLTPILEPVATTAASGSSRNSDGKGLAMNVSAATTSTVSSISASDADGGSTSSNDDDTGSRGMHPDDCTDNGLVAIATSSSNTRYHGGTTEDRLKRRLVLSTVVLCCNPTFRGCSVHVCLKNAGIVRNDSWQNVEAADGPLSKVTQ